MCGGGKFSVNVFMLFKSGPNCDLFYIYVTVCNVTSPLIF